MNFFLPTYSHVTLISIGEIMSPDHLDLGSEHTSGRSPQQSLDAKY